MNQQQTNALMVEEVQQGYADTWNIGGSRFPFYSEQAFDPYAYVGTTTVVPMALLSAPPTYGQLDSASASYGSAGRGSRIANSAPWSPSKSPLPLTIAALVIGVVVFHWLYYKDRRRK